VLFPLNYITENIFSRSQQKKFFLLCKNIDFLRFTSQVDFMNEEEATT